MGGTPDRGCRFSAPVGLLEVNLAERAALLLWRLQRLARYEAEMVAAGVGAVDVPPLPPPEDEFSSLHEAPKQKSRDEQLRDIRRELRAAREELADFASARDYFRLEAEAEGSVPVGVAECILNTACACAEVAENLRTDPPEFESKAFLRKLVLSGSDPRKVDWTPGLIGRGIALYAGYTEEAPEKFRAGVAIELEEWVEEVRRTVRRLEGQAVAVAQLLAGGKARQKVEVLLPGAGRDERIAKYERHLHNLLTSTLHELERLQARRSGEPVVPPVVADVTVTVEATPG